MAIELDDGTIVRSLPEQVAYNDERIIDNTQEITDLKTKIEAALAGVFHYKGSVATYADLPASDNQVGDVWNVIDTGKNYAWSGSAWDDLGGAIDISNLVTLNTPQTITGVKTFSNGIKFRANEGISSPNTNLLIFKTTSNEFYFNSNAQAIYANSSDISLGRSTYKFKDLYLSGKANFSYSSGTDFSIAKSSQYNLSIYYGNDIRYNFQSYSFFPQLNNQQDLGNDSNYWRHLYMSGLFNPNSSGYGLALPSTASLTENSEVVDTASAQTITGIKKFSNGIKIGQAEILIEFSSGFNALLIGKTGTQNLFRGNIIPFANNDYFLGGPSNKWKDLYLSRNLTDGTNSVTVADLAALIAYAKAQGWIS